MTDALSTLNTLPSNKEQLKVFSRQLKDEILASNTDPLKILVQLKFAEKLIAEALKDEELDLHFLKEFEKYESEKIVAINGAKLSQSEVGTKYLYEETGDPVWMDLDKQIKGLTEKKKEREKLLQQLPDTGMVDPDSGLYVTRAPKSSKTKVKVIL